MPTRRDAMLRMGHFGLGTLTLPGLLAAKHASPAKVRPAGGKAKSCILVFLWGGPPQQDLWDMKPDAPAGIRSLFSPIRTRVPGVDICEHMPLLARHTDKLAIVRSLTRPNNEHEVGVAHMLSGRSIPSLRVPINQPQAYRLPRRLGDRLLLHAAGASCPRASPSPRPSATTASPTRAPMAASSARAMTPSRPRAAHRVNSAPFALSPPPEVGPERLAARGGLLARIEAAERRLQTKDAASGLSAFHEQAMRLATSPVAKKAFDLGSESAALRDRYGRNQYGDSLLLCRRLVEAGVRLVTMTWQYTTPSGAIANVWDNHGGTGVLGGVTGYAMLDAPYCIPPLDCGFSALLEDLDGRGMLDETMVVALGEMGRTPKINPTAGRDHWGAAQTALLAGGGIRGGQVYGATDKQAAYVKDNPVRPEDLLATTYHALGIDTESEIHDREGRPVKITEGKVVERLFG